MDAREILAVLCVAISMWNCGSGGPMAGEPMPDPSTRDDITIQGSVRDAVGSRPGVTVTLSQLGGTIAEAVTNQQGRYDFRDVAPGEYVLSIPEISEWACITRRIVTVSTDGITADFHCRRRSMSTRVVGTVTVNGFPVSSRVVVLGNGSESWTTISDAAGGYSFGNVAPGVYSIAVETIHTDCPTDRSVTVPEAFTVRADLACTGQVVTGTLTLNGSAVKGADVTLCEGSVRDSAHCDRIAATDFRGRYTHADLSPGSYFVLYRFWGVECLEEDPVAVEAGASVTLDLVCVGWGY